MNTAIARLMFPPSLHWHVQRGIKLAFAMLVEYQAPYTVFWDTYAKTFKSVVR